MVWPILLLAPLVLCSPSTANWPVPTDACALIAGKKWVSPAEARACLYMAPLNEDIRTNTIEVLNKTLAFHTSVNYQISAPEPFKSDVHEDLHADLARISTQKYSSEFEFHLDIFHAFRRVNDGHCVALNYCYDSFYVSYLPLPLVLLTAEDGSQDVHIAPEAFDVASAEFGDEIEFWQEALPANLKHKLESLSGARVLTINGQHPLVSVNANAKTTGGFQSFGTRQNAFFSSYHRGSGGWEYVMGNFAQHVHPLVDGVELVVQRLDGEGAIDIVSLPYRSRFGSGSNNFTDFASYRANNCLATPKTNGHDLYDAKVTVEDGPSAAAYFQQQPPVDPREARQHPMNVILDASPMTNIELPEKLQPALNPLNESYSVAEFFLLNDNTTGVLALGSFSAAKFSTFQSSLHKGLKGLKDAGAKKLVVDVTNNGGGFICIAHWLHRLIIGRSESTEPQAGLDTSMRAGPLAQAIVQKIQKGADPKTLLSYNAVQWTNASNDPFSEGDSVLEPVLKKLINGHEDAFGRRLGQECQPFAEEPPAKGFFLPEDVIIVSNGRCASSCSLFSITMAKIHGVRTVVVGGYQDTFQHYAGVVGGQSTDFSTIDTEIKSTGLKNHTLAPPDFMTHSVQGITWRLGYGIWDPTEPEEWQDHTADLNFHVTAETVNKPVAIWEAVAKEIWEVEQEEMDDGHSFRLQDGSDFVLA
ncbi:hypothetical protein CYLTODRAFT_423021 [Cylindrobasidium torrendii FP15055 ss-10]|uniref:Tail specific protease domain-containing protein n=1 Tax=Cylindrobasidium torrendii FP15055 ss-10 TaxID=1314674 RepID=A0A0D7BBI9_9AGAR|nr:hypothetical protein CYLTODRAFT_423021 [Cylindrobasidium torrendii FP15055 ss-10]